MNLSEEQIDGLQELVNIGVGRAAGTLNQMVNSHISLQVPFMKVLCLQSVKQELQHRLNSDKISSVQLSFSGSFKGTAQLVFPTESACILVSALTGENLDGTDLNAVKIGTLSEVGNIVVNGVMGSIANVLEEHLDYAIPVYVEDTIEGLLSSSDPYDDVSVILAQARFKIEQLHITGDIILIFTVGSFDNLLQSLKF